MNNPTLPSAPPVVRPRLFFIAFVLLTVSILQPLLPALITGAIFAFLTEPFAGFLHKKFLAKRGSLKATILSVIAMFLIIAGILLPFTFVVVGTLERVAASIRILSTGTVSTIVKNWASQLAAIPENLSIPINSEQISNLLTQAAQNSLTMVGKFTGDLLSQMPGAVWFAVLTVISWGYFLWQGRILRVEILRYLIPWAPERLLIRQTFASLLKTLVAANLLVSLIQALIILVFLASTGVPHALLWSALAFFASFIPVVGTLPITLGAALWCWTADGSPAKAIALVVCAFVAGSSDNVLRPLLSRGSGQLDPFWLFLAIMGGLSQFGIAGLLLGPLALTLCIASAVALREALKSERNRENINAQSS
jgi:predicted PurR-regulated permease PerM